jgi:hypothetical protein
MSSEAGNSTGGSWHANGSYPASAVSGPNAGESESRPSRPDHLPTVEERLSEIVQKYGDRVFRPVAESHDFKLREDALQEPDETERTIEIGEGETAKVYDTVSRDALPWIALIEDFLRDYESYRDKWLKLARGRQGMPEYESFTVPLNNSFSPAYQKRQYARLKALKRQFLGEGGDDSPTGETFGGVFDEPVTVLFGLTASSTSSSGTYRPPAEHDREIRDAWSGSDGVRRTLRYVLQDQLGLDSTEYAWWWQSEPHPGGGDASGYSHSHPVVILDGSAVSGAVDPADQETYRPVVAKHVAETPGAEWSAHRLEDAVTVREDGEINDFAGYVSEYLSVAPDDDLLERSAEYIMWAATQWATTTQKYSKSRTATAAITADACHQRYADPEAEQSADHGEEVVRSDRPGVEFECAHCGSEFNIDQSPETLTSARVAAADGGLTVEEVADEQPPESEPEDVLRGLWSDARAAARVGGETEERQCSHGDGANECPLCCEPGVTVPGETPIPDDATASVDATGSVAFERLPEWRPEAIVRKDADEETLIGSPGGVEYGRVIVEGVGSISDRLDRTLLPEWLEGPEPWRDSPVAEREVRSGELPPPELVHREYAESLNPNRRVTAKRWESDWYAQRYESDGLGGESAKFDKERIRRFVENNPDLTVMQVMGQLSLPPVAMEAVEKLVS